MKKVISLLLLGCVAGLIQAQNITDLAVLNDRSTTSADLDDWTTGPAIQDSVFLCPDRVRYDSRCLQIEGQDVFLLSGTMHYFRTPQPLWRDRLEKIKAMGFNGVETYVPWNWHEREMPSSPDDFSKMDLRELDDFLTLAEEVGLYTIVRPGPYICAEWSGGGFPQWLMQKRPAQTLHEVWLQSMDPEFLRWNDHWYEAVARVVAPHQLSRKPRGAYGVVLMQVENEFNRIKWFPRSEKRQYLEHMAQQLRRGGIEVPLISCWTDEARNVQSGALNGVVDMVNSYPRWQIRKGFGRLINQQLKSQPGKPLIGGELQGGWSSDLRTALSWDMDGQTPAQTQNITLYALQRGFCALNYYMLVGSTNLDDWAARNQTASYDFAAAIGEDGTLNERYYRLQALATFIKEHGTRIARSRIEPVQYQTTDTLVELLVRRHPDGTRYLFVRTEEHSGPHRGQLKIKREKLKINNDTLTIDFNLEPFGSVVYVLSPSAQEVPLVQKFPLAHEVPLSQVPLSHGRGVRGEASRPPRPQLLFELPTQAMADQLPTRWTKLSEGKTVDALGHYDRHFIYYKVRAKVKRGGLLTVPIVGKGQMNNTDADQVIAVADGLPLASEQPTDTTVSFRVPQGTKQLLLLYDTRGLHHHTNLAVERTWLIGPSHVWLDGKPLPLSFAATERQRGITLSEGRSMMEEGRNTPSSLTPLKWFTSAFTIPLSHGRGVRGEAPLYIHLEQQGNGFLYVNGHCLGRCYDYGPQRDYYIPDCWLNRDGDNHVAVSLMPNAQGEAAITQMALMAAAETPRTCAYDQPVEDVRRRIDQYVERHQSDPQWLLSRMAMYWKEGEHYTQCYISHQHWHHGEGNAPVPTLRLPGERTWNKNPRPRLADLKPYNETGDLTVTDSKTGETITTPYPNTGHSVRSINGEILGIAADAAYVFSQTNDERYARLAADVFNQALLGIYYMNPVINLTPRDTEGRGGWEEGGILGYYDYEQIHDDIGLRLATIYDYAREYLLAHPTEAMHQTGKDTRRLMNEVMRRFIDLGMIRGGRNGAHLSPNGLALQLYGYGYALSPDASAYESYWSEDHAYHQSVQGANTILQGYQAGPVQLDVMIPAIDTTSVFAADAAPDSPIRLATMSAAEKRRTVVLVKGGKGLGYYLDIFDPGMDSTDYVMHTVGRELTILPNEADGTCQALWTVNDSIRVRLWVSGGTTRQYTQRMNPSSYTNSALTPDGVSTRGLPTPPVYAHQDANVRYANLYEVFCEGRPAIQSVRWQYRNGQPSAMTITLMDGTQDHVRLEPNLSINFLRKSPH